MKNNQPEKHECLPRRPDPAVKEAMSVYSAWLAYLLTRLGESELRVPVADIAQALKSIRCDVSREGEDYVIRMKDEGREVMPGEPAQP